MIPLNEKSKNRIQIIRAIAIISVLVIHTVGQSPYELYIRPLVNFGVGVFLFLSGFLTPHIEDVKVFYTKRILRVFIPYLVWSLLLCVVYGDYQDLAWNLLTFQESSIYYYIFVYLQITLLVPILWKLLDARYYWLGLAITPVAILVEVIWALTGHYLIYPWNINNCLVWISFVYLGMLFRRGIIRIRGRYQQWSIVMGLAMFLEVLEGKFWLSFGRKDFATTQVKLSSMFVTGCVCVLVFFYITGLHKDEIYTEKGSKKEIFRRIVISIGDASFGIYLVHPLVIYFLRHNTGFLFPLNTILTLILTYLCVWIGQRICGKKLGRYLGFY